jgi:hypothetical protein
MSSTNTLKARIASELNRSLTDAFGNAGETFAYVVNKALNQAQQHYESQPFRWNQVRRSEWTTATLGATGFSLPADFIEMRKLEIIYNAQFFNIPKASIEDVDQINCHPSMTAYASTIPVKHAIEGNMVRIAPPTNATRTLAASYTRRFLPTSITGSETVVIPVAGSYSLTVTTSASHHNRINGWTTDGADLICARAKAIIKIDYLNDSDAKQEMAMIGQGGLRFLSIAEKQAYDALADETFDALALGKIRKYGL